MNLKVQVKMLDLFAKLVNGKVSKISYIDYAPQKAEYREIPAKMKLKRTTPEAQGVSSGYLLEFMKALEKDDTSNIQGIMITRHNCVILEAAYKPYNLSTWRVTHSLAKTVVGIAVGIAQDEGLFSIHDNVSSFFGKKPGHKAFPVIANRKKEITIKDLLTMSSGVGFNEATSMVEVNWTDSFLDASVAFEPGTEFAYNSLNTYMLSAIIEEKTGQNLMEFLKERMFAPMGIENVHWELSPEQKVKGGWGLYISLEDRTKIGQLFLNRGVWEGQRIVSEAWLEEMTTKHMDTPEKQNDYGYGYQLWMAKRKGSFLFNGLFGQNLMVLPDLDMVISIIASNRNLFIKCPMMDIVEHFFADESFHPGDPLPENHKQSSLLNNYLSQLCYQKEFHPAVPVSANVTGWKRSLGRKRSRFGSIVRDVPKEVLRIPECLYKAEENNAGIMPIVVQAMQNCFSQGMTTFQFQRTDECLWLHIEEGEQCYHIPIGFQKPRYSSQIFQEETYRISAWGIMKTTEDDIPVLKLQIAFLEMTNCRNMKFYFYGKEKAVICYTETPDPEEVLNQSLETLDFSLPANGIETIKNMDKIKDKLGSMLEPNITAFAVQEQKVL